MHRAGVRWFRPIARASALGALLALGGCGNDDGDSVENAGGGGGGGLGGEGPGGASGGGGTPPQCPDETGPVEPTALLDDFEDADGNLARTASRNGSWWVAADATPGGQMTPAPNGPFTAEAILGERCGSGFGVRVTGQGFDDWGSVLGFSFAYDANGIVNYDVSAYRGVTFWARVGETHTATVRMNFSDVYADPEAGMCDPAGGAMGCHDTFGTELLPISTEWRQYLIYFDTLGQQGFGWARDALDTTQVRNFGVTFTPGSVFDFWIDDVWLVR